MKLKIYLFLIFWCLFSINIFAEEKVNVYENYKQLASALAQKKDTSAIIYLNIIQKNDEIGALSKKALIAMAEYFRQDEWFGDAEKYYLQVFDDEFSYKMFADDLLNFIKVEVRLFNQKKAGDLYTKLIINTPRFDNIAQYEKIRTQILKDFQIKDAFTSFADYFKYCVALYNGKQYAAAKENFKNILAQYPNNPKTDEIKYFLGLCEVSQNNIDQAIAYFKPLADTSSSDVHEKAVFNLGKAYLSTGNIETANVYFLEIARGQGDNASSAWYNLYNSFQKQKNEAGFQPYWTEFNQKFNKFNAYNQIIWESGWQKFQDKKYAEAHAIFDKMSEGASDSWYKSRILYFDAKCLLKLKVKDKALVLLEKCVNDYPFSYFSYRILKTYRGKVIPKNKITIVEDKGIELELGYKILADAGLEDAAVLEIRYRLNKNKVPLTGEARKVLLAQLAVLLAKEEEFYDSIMVVRQIFSLESCKDGKVPRSYAELLFPQAYWEKITKYSSEFKIDPYLVASIMYSESGFKHNVVCAASDTGLMQVIPPTGELICYDLNVTWKGQDMLLDPDTNIRFGTYYLSERLQEFKGLTHMAIAAYNAGPGRVRKQMQQFEDDIDFFILTFPKPVTQAYVIRVLERYWLYQKIYGITNNSFGIKNTQL